MKNFSTHNFRFYRKKLKLTLAAMAERLNAISDRKYTHQSVSNYERGVYPLPLDTILEACQIFGITLQEFICTKGEDSNDTATQPYNITLQEPHQVFDEPATQYFTATARYVSINNQKAYLNGVRSTLPNVDIPFANSPYALFEIAGRELAPQLIHGDIVVAEKTTVDAILPRTTCVIITADKILVRNATKQGDIVTLTAYDDINFPRYHVTTSEIMEIFVVTRKITATW